jgi:phosphohistidine phosphatase SixA
VLMRHAATDPGAGDPPGFRLDDCATQRNLSAAGREDARRVGNAFRAHRIPVARVRRPQPVTPSTFAARLTSRGATHTIAP